MIDLVVEAGKVRALVSGSSLYRIEIVITPVAAPVWKRISAACAGQIDSLVELVQGKLSDGVMEVMTRKGEGLFPTPRQIRMKCSCPDYATMCKHVAVTLYGVGARLDEQPELLFTLREVDPSDLLGEESASSTLMKAPAGGGGRVLEGADLSGIFGIDIDLGAPATETPAAPPGGAIRKGRAKGESATITAKELAGRGVPHPTIQTWLRSGILIPTGQRGVYGRTAATEERLSAHMARRRQA